MRDLRRPAAREDAKQLLLARIDDVGLRSWIIEEISQDQINRLAIYVRAGLNDATIIASWQAELDSENAATDEAMKETARQAELMRNSHTFSLHPHSPNYGRRFR